jgi:hypothetical protein
LVGPGGEGEEKKGERRGDHGVSRRRY